MVWVKEGRGCNTGDEEYLGLLRVGGVCIWVCVELLLGRFVCVSMWCNDMRHMHLFSGTWRGVRGVREVDT